MHPIMKDALENTYGIIVYQEQVMQISKEMCGFSGGQADTLRKGIGKKIPEVLDKLKNEFIEGAVKTVGADRRMMEQFWQQLMDFAFTHVEVQAVSATTLAEPNASNNVLQKIGMKFMNEIDDPEDGKLWRYQITRSEYAAR